MSNRLISDDEQKKIVRRLLKGETDSSKIAAKVGVRIMSVAGVWSGLTKKGVIPAALGMPRAQRSKRSTSKAANLSKKNALLRRIALWEGAIQQRLVKYRVRDPNARRQCIAEHGTKCCICTFSFEARYRKVADGFTHVHHVRQLSNIGKEHKVDPIKHLRPVCPNCHAVLHLKNPAYSIEEVKSFLRR
jgi:predicted HNH restriction endonuclease